MSKWLQEAFFSRTCCCRSCVPAHPRALSSTPAVSSGSATSTGTISSALTADIQLHRRKRSAAQYGLYTQLGNDPAITNRGRHAKHADLKQYATSKLMELMAAEEMSRRLHVRIRRMSCPTMCRQDPQLSMTAVASLSQFRLHRRVLAWPCTPATQVICAVQSSPACHVTRHMPPHKAT